MARSPLARTLVVAALTACTALTAGVAAGAASADPPATISEVPGQGVLHNPHLTEALGRKLK